MAGSTLDSEPHAKGNEHDRKAALDVYTNGLDASTYARSNFRVVCAVDDADRDLCDCIRTLRLC